MNKKMIIAGFVSLSMLIVMLGTVAAAPSISTITISGPGVVWQFNPIPSYGEVISVQAYYYLKSGGGEMTLDNPINTIISDNLVTIIFSSSDTIGLTGKVDTTGVHVTASEGEYDIPAGPGFAWGRTR